MNRLSRVLLPGLAGLVVLGAGRYAGTAGALVAAEVLAVLALAGLLLTLPARPAPALGGWRRVTWPWDRRHRAGPGVGARSRFPAYDRLYAVVLLAGTSRRHVELALRPVLQRIVQPALADRGRDAVRSAVGERLWELLDPDRPVRHESGPAGLDRRALSELLDRLESL